MNRTESLDRIRHRRTPWDVCVIGGGATGMGIALDAASRGYETVLLERDDFGKATSSRSTKMIHGGVRYLAQGRIGLVREALEERAILRRLAPAAVHPVELLVPAYAWWERPFYGIGLALYDLIARDPGFGRSSIISAGEAAARVPGIEKKRLRGAVSYFDGQFDDARLLIGVARTAAQQGAALVNYCGVTGFLTENGTIRGVVAADGETGGRIEVRAQAVINATGIFSDEVRRMADSAAQPTLALSSGAHIVLDKSFLGGGAGLLVPKTRDGRVMFALPWLGHALIGTTDIPVDVPRAEPPPASAEIDEIIETATPYLERTPRRTDILSAFAGLRPLVKGGSGPTAALSREHTILVEKAGLISISGGKWTTYRRMAKDCVDLLPTTAGLPSRPCRTAAIPLDCPQGPVDAARAAREEMARTVEDVLARRTRLLFLNARAAVEQAAGVARDLAIELSRDEAWQTRQVEEFTALAKQYLPA